MKVAQSPKLPKLLTLFTMLLQLTMRSLLPTLTLFNLLSLLGRASLTVRDGYPPGHGKIWEIRFFTLKT